MSQNAISEKLHIHHRKVSEYQEALGIADMNRDNNNPKQAVKRATERALEAGYADLDTAVCEMAKLYHTAELARLLDVSHRTMSYWLQVRGITPLRPHWKRTPMPSVVIDDVARREPLPRESVPAWVAAVPIDMMHLRVRRKVRLIPGELWCAECGETVEQEHGCMHCGGHETVAAESVLRPGEWETA